MAVKQGETVLLFYNRYCIAVFTKVRTIAPKMAAHHPSISKPLIKAAAIFNTAPFTTKVNIPNVTIFIGKVKSIKNGPIKALVIPMLTAAASAEPKLSIRKPLTIFEVTRTASAEISQ